MDQHVFESLNVVIRSTIVFILIACNRLITVMNPLQLATTSVIIKIILMISLAPPWRAKKNANDGHYNEITIVHCAAYHARTVPLLCRVMMMMVSVFT